MQECMYDNLWLMFQDMKAHSNNHQSKIICADDYKTLQIGWYCTKTGYYFRIKLSDIRSRKALKFPFNNDASQLFIDLLTEMIIDTKGRIRVADLMSWNGSPYTGIQVFDRLIKLKAFW